MKFDQTSGEVLSELGTRAESGLSEREAADRLKTCGPNRLEAKKAKSLILRFLEQLADPLIYILLAAAAVSGALGEVSDALIILAVVLINAFVGLVQESKAEKALEALKKMSSPKAAVRRDGSIIEIASELVVPGDIVMIDAGRIIPCDLRWIETANLKVDESALTGESVPAEKDASAIQEREEVPLGDRRNSGFMSTVAVYGRGVGVAVGTGMKTEIGKIADLIGANEGEETPLQKKLADFGRKLGTVILVLCGFMFAVEAAETAFRIGGVPKVADLLEFFLEAVSLAVAAIPEGLPAIVTIVLAIGVQKMIQRNAIVRKLPAVETLGSVNVICSDKTGTLTQNRMTVQRLSVDGMTSPAGTLDPKDADGRLLVECLALCNDASCPSGKCQGIGDPTEVALLELAKTAGFPPADLASAHPRVAEKPFDSVRKLMSTVNSFGNESLVLTKGATDVLLGICTGVLENGKVVPLTAERSAAILAQADAMSRDALRVLGAAYKPLPAGPVDPEALERELCFIGLVGMIDPPRLEVKDSIESCRRSGIETVMITGDHRNTAFAIAKELGIAHDEGQVLSGTDLDALSDAELVERVARVRVFARVSPEHKVRIVRAFKASGAVVSMTGDGVNDAPSLKAADIGVAMGISGTDVAKGAADMILTDDNFTTIVAAIREGRTIYANIRKSILFLLSCNLGEIIAVFGAIMLGWDPPLKPIHLLWLNLITDVLPALALGMDPGDPGVMNERPRSRNESLFAHGGGLFTAINGIVVGFITLAAFRIGLAAYEGGLMPAQTMAFAVLSVSELIYAFAMRHPHKTLFEVGFLGNPWLIGATVVGIFLQLIIIMVPAFAAVFRVSPLALTDWLVVTLFVVTPFAVNEIAKLALRAVRARRA